MKTGFRPSLGERLLGLFLPPRCLGCGEAVPPGSLFCPPCRADLPEGFCRRRIVPEDGRVLEIASALPFEGGFRKTLHQLKFHGQSSLAKAIARLMAQAAQELDGPFDCVAYVSMDPEKRRKRGYDQSRLLAKYTAAELGLPLSEGLVKVRGTRTQHELNAGERRENLRSAYRCREDMTGRAVLLVDDIVTTGSSLAECARALREAGAAKVCGVCAAETPHKPQKGDETHGNGKN